MAEEIGNSIDLQRLTGVVAQALSEPNVRLGNWQVKQLSGGYEQFNRAYLLTGQAFTPAGERSWSLVLKTMLCDPSNDGSPQSTRYWKREATLYQSGLIDDLTCALAPPRCYQVNQAGDGVWIWLEAIHETVSRPWSDEKYAEAARCLGCFNAAYRTGKPLPVEPWLAQHWLRGYLDLAAPMLQELPQLRKLSFFQKSFTGMSDDFILRAWERRDEFLHALDHLPQTFCHQDAFDGNLLWRHLAPGQDQLVALDWAYSGVAALGTELAPLVFMKLMTIPESEHMLRFYELCLQGYLAGLADAGYTANVRQVRFASLATIFYRYLYGANLGELWAGLRDEANHPFIASMFGLPSVDYLFSIGAALVPFYQAIFQQIDELLPQIA